MFLNDFRKGKVLEIYKKLKSEDKTNIVFWGKDDEYYKDDIYLALMYESELHRIFIFQFNQDGPLYPNPDCTPQLVPEKQFLGKIKPSDAFKKIFK